MALHTHTGTELARRLAARKKKMGSKRTRSSHNSGHGESTLVGSTKKKSTAPRISSHNTGQAKRKK